MPAVMENFLNDLSYLNAQRTQAALLDTYRQDCAKYSKHMDLGILEAIFNSSS